MFQEVLPPTGTITGAKKEIPRMVGWISLSGLTTGSGTEVLGVMELVVQKSKNRKESCSYIVTETSTHWNGRAFHLKKSKGQDGSDADNQDYDVFCGRNNQDRQCQCKGFLRWNWCKHIAGILTLIENGQLPPEEPVSVDADCGSTEEPHQVLPDWEF